MTPSNPHALFLPLALAFTAFAAGCQGPPGADGRAGADGEQGPKGADGQDGLDGQDGQDGQDGRDGRDGTDGIDGQDGDDGQDGQDGSDGGRDGHSGVAPWGVDVEILEVTGGTGASGGIVVGDVVEVRFSVTDDRGTDYALSELSELFFALSGPATHPQVLVSPEDLADVATEAVYNRDGTYTYTFPVAIPATFAAPAHDTTDLGEDHGDWGGLAVDSDLDGDGVLEIDGTFTLALVAGIDQVDPDGTAWSDADDTVALLLGGASSTLAGREVVLADNCANCHGDEGFRQHGGSRRSLDVCLTCHVDGAEDAYSDTDPSVTPGVTISFRSMVHKIHQGEALEDGFSVVGLPVDASLDGYPDYNLHDYGAVAFPSMPMAAADCDACHAGGDGSERNTPSRQACGSCHDGVSFTQSDRTADDYHRAGPMSDDSLCAYCHGPAAIHARHDDPRTAADVWEAAGHAVGRTGLEVTVLGAVNQDGDTTFEVGDQLTVTFTVLYDDGTPVPASFFAYSATSSTCPTVAGGATVILSGPSEHMQRVAYSPSPSSTSTAGSVYAGSTVDSATGTWTYTLLDGDGNPQTIPATYPLQANETESTLAGAPYGSRYGEPLDAGTYRVGVALYTSMWDEWDCRADATRYRAADTAYVDVLFGGASALEPRAVAQSANCDDCHGRVAYHRGTRVDTEYCVTCHTPGAMDDEDSPTDTVDFKNVVHKLHASSLLSDGYTVGSDTWSVGFPRSDGGVAACVACHSGDDAYRSPSTRACITCHDSDYAAGHAAIMTDDTFGETCEVCHGESSEISVEAAHEFLR